MDEEMFEDYLENMPSLGDVYDGMFNVSFPLPEIHEWKDTYNFIDSLPEK